MRRPVITQGIRHRCNQAELGDRNSEFRGAGRDPKVAGGGDNATAADRVTPDHGDDRLRQAAQRRLQLLRGGVVGERALGRGEVLAEFADVRTRDEDPVTGAGENEHAHRAVLGKGAQRLREQASELEAQRIAHVRTIDRQPRDGTANVDQELLRHAGTLSSLLANSR
jgi:hypothetical protein